MATAMTENPMLIEEILETVFQYVTHVRDLKSVRLVCRSWKKESLKQWREHGVLVLEQARSSNKSGMYPTMTDYLMMMMGEEGELGGGSADLKQPFRRFKLKNRNVYEGCWSSKDELQQGLLGGAAAVVTYLHLDHCTLPHPTFLDSWLAKSFPNLLKLWTNCEFRGGRDWGDDLGVNSSYPRWANFVRKFHPSLKTLEVIEDVYDEDPRGTSYSPQHLIPYHIEMFLFGCPWIDELIIRKQEKDGFNPGGWHGHMTSFIRNLTIKRYGNVANSNNNIRKMDIMDFYWESVFRFAEGNHPYGPNNLEELTVDVGSHSYYEDASSIFRKLIGSRNNTLQVLKAFRAPLNDPYESVPLPGRMEHLRELHLWGTFTTDLTFLQYTPALQTLVLRRKCFDKEYKLKGMLRDHYLLYYTGDVVEATLARAGRGGQEALLAVPQLEHLEIDYDFGPETLAVLATWAPNMRTLKMRLNNDILQAVSEVWPKLTGLECLFGSKVDDNGVACLRQMEDLRKFKLNAFCDRSFLSSSSKDVFLGMTALLELDICVSNEMSKKSEAELMKRIPRVNLIRNSALWGHQHECCEQLKFVKRFRPTARMEPSPNSNDVCIVA